MGVCILLLMTMAVTAQPPHNVVGYNKDNNTLTTVHYGYGNSVDNITVAGEVQTTISLNGQGMPTERHDVTQLGWHAVGDRHSAGQWREQNRQTGYA